MSAKDGTSRHNIEKATEGDYGDGFASSCSKATNLEILFLEIRLGSIRIFYEYGTNILESQATVFKVVG